MHVRVSRSSLAAAAAAATTCQPLERTDSERFARPSSLSGNEYTRAVTLRGNVINPLAAGMYKSIGEPAVSSNFAVSVIKFVEANCVCEAWMKFPLGRRFLLFQISEVRYATIISISLAK